MYNMRAKMYNMRAIMRKPGYVSNAVVVDGIWAMNAFIRGSYREGAQWNLPHVGEILHRPKVYVRLYKDGGYEKYEDCTSGPDEDGFKSLGDRCVQKWYRYNPWTREKIELTPYGAWQL